VLTRTFWNGLDYHIAFDDDAEPCRIDDSTLQANDDGLPAWIAQGDFVSSAEFDNGVQLASAEELARVDVSHRYALAGIHEVKLVVSGQLTQRGPTGRAEVAVSVEVRDWPSLGDVIGDVTLASQSRPAYVNESVEFVYAVEKIVQNVSYHVHFGTDPEKTVSERRRTSLSYIFLSIIARYPDKFTIFIDHLKLDRGGLSSDFFMHLSVACTGCT